MSAGSPPPDLPPVAAANALLPPADGPTDGPTDVLVAAEPQWQPLDSEDEESDLEGFARGGLRSDEDASEVAFNQQMVYSMLHPDQVDAAARANNRRHTTSFDSEGSEDAESLVPAGVSQAAAEAVAFGWAPAQGRRRGSSLVTQPLETPPEPRQSSRRASDRQDSGSPSP
jgi:hypothetical protein